MTPLKIAQVGQPVLRKKTENVKEENIKSPEIQKLIDDMVYGLHKENGVGIAAPQIFQSIRMIALHVPYSKNAYRKAKIPLTIIINPQITKTSKNKELDWEGCLSVAEGNLKGIVPRYKRIRVEGYDRNGQKIKLTAYSFKARIIQHEIDHLNGVLFVDRIRKQDLKYLSSNKEWVRFYKADWPHPRPL